MKLRIHLRDVPCSVCGAINRDKFGNCRTCAKRHKRKYKDAHVEKAAKYRKDYRYRHPDRYKAQQAVHRAVKSGRLVRSPFCQLCWTVTEDITGHHQDYSKRLEVVWLCRPCHRFVHGEAETVGDYVKFTPTNITDDWRTKAWIVRTIDGVYDLGLAKWLPKRREYVHAPSPDVFINSGCLRAIADFCDAQSNSYRNEFKRELTK